MRRFVVVFVLITLLLFLIFPPIGVDSATFESSPSSGNFITTCDQSYDIMVDTQGVLSNAADIEINYNPAEITIIDSDPGTPGVQVQTGDAYDVYVANNVDTVTGTIQVVASTFFGGLNGTARFITIEFQANSGVTSSGFTINFTGVGDTLDSNIADAGTSNDLLTSVTNANFTFYDSASCTVDTTQPNINFVSPVNGQSGVPVNSNVQVQFTDSESNIDISSLSVTVAGITYTQGDPEFSYSGSGNNITVTINPPSNFSEGQNVSVSASGSDGASNSRTRNMSFTTFITPTSTPVPTLTPTPGPTATPGPTPTPTLTPTPGPTATPTPTPIFFAQCGEVCGGTTGCESVLQCVEGLCRLPSCALYGDNNCTCTPPPLPEGQPQQCVEYVTETITIQETIYEYLDDIPGPVGETVDEVSPAGVATGFLTLSLLMSLLPGLLALRTPQLFLVWLATLFKRKRTPWGIVYDSTTDKPIPFAIVRAYLDGTSSVIEQRITDEEGRYGLLLPVGKYRVEVKHAQFQEARFNIEVKEENAVIPNDVALSPKGGKVVNIVRKRNIFSKILEWLQKHQWKMVIFGLILSLIAYYISPVFYNLATLIFYMLAAVVQFIFSKRTIKRWGTVIDSESNLRIPYVNIKLFDANTWELVDTQMTNLQGKFGLFDGEGEYAIVAAKRGYKYPSAKQRDLKQIPNKYGVLGLNIVKDKDLDIVLYLDPIHNGKGFIVNKNKGSAKTITKNINPEVTNGRKTNNPFASNSNKQNSFGNTGQMANVIVDNNSVQGGSMQSNNNVVSGQNVQNQNSIPQGMQTKVQNSTNSNINQNIQAQQQVTQNQSQQGNPQITSASPNLPPLQQNNLQNSNGQTGNFVQGGMPMNQPDQNASNIPSPFSGN